MSENDFTNFCFSFKWLQSVGTRSQGLSSCHDENWPGKARGKYKFPAEVNILAWCVLSFS